MNQPLHLDLFSGIVGFAIAAQAAGYQTIGFCEREPYAQQILKERFGAVLADAERERNDHEGRGEIAGTAATMQGQAQQRERIRPDTWQRNSPRLHPDIFDLDGTEYAGIDLLTGGFPCQPFSVAGKRLGAADDRAIWPQMLRVIAEARPAWIIGENVAGIVTMELDNILSDLEALGYSAWPLVIPACAVDAKHRRDRVWIVAHSTEREDNGRNGGSMDEAQGRRQGQHATANSGGQDVADAMRRRRQGQGQPFHAEHSAQASNGKAAQPVDGRQSGIGSTQPAVRGVAHGLPKGLDRNEQFCQWPDEAADTPRVTTGIKHRTHRLKGLGNAIVPQVAETLLRMMARMENSD